MSTNSDVLKDVPFSFASRFSGARRVSPEEPLAAPFARCFNRALANNFDKNRFEAEAVGTKGSLELGMGPDGNSTVASINIVTSAKVPGMKDGILQHCAQRAQTHCAIDKILSLQSSLNALLEE